MSTSFLLHQRHSIAARPHLLLLFACEIRFLRSHPAFLASDKGSSLLLDKRDIFASRLYIWPSSYGWMGRVSSTTASKLCNKMELNSTIGNTSLEFKSFGQLGARKHNLWGSSNRTLFPKHHYQTTSLRLSWYEVVVTGSDLPHL